MTDRPKRYTSKRDIAVLFLRQDGKCKCGTKLVKGNYIIEHVQPLSRGGTDTLDNKCLNCKPCAAAKTFHPRSLATTLGGDHFEAFKTKRLRGELQPKKLKRKIQSRGFDRTRKRGFDGVVRDRE